MIRIGLLGASGRMGKWVTQLIQTEFSSSATLVSAARQDLSPLLETDVVIDFAIPAGMQTLGELALKSKKLPAFVVGSTGWKPEEKKVLENLATKTPVLVASNFSIGVFAMSEILRNFSPLFKKLGYKPALVEAHHIHKKDAPSGTALSLCQAIDSQHPEQVQTHSIRAGEVIGDHEVTFYGAADRISIGHFAQDRSIFARGSIEVALWLAQQKQNPEFSTASKIMGIENYFRSIQKGI